MAKGFDFDYEFSHFVDMKDEELGATSWSEEDLHQLAEHFFALGKLVAKTEELNLFNPKYYAEVVL